jgi:hypothetical protein
LFGAEKPAIVSMAGFSFYCAGGIEVTEESSVDKGPKGFGGWLNVAVIVICLAIVLTCINICYDAFELTAEEWKPVRTAYPGVAISAAISLFLGVTSVSLGVFTLNLILSENFRAPDWAINFIVLTTLASTFDNVSLYYFSKVFSDFSLTARVPDDMSRAYVGCVLWIIYFARSERVKNTFTKGTKT